MTSEVFKVERVGEESKREEFEPKKSLYDLKTLGIWETVIASERKEVEFDKLAKIEVEKIKIPPRTIIIPCSFRWHGLGYVESVSSGGRIKKIQQDREINEVFFRPVHDGCVEKGDLLTILNVLYAQPKPELSPSELKWLRRRKKHP